MAGIEVLLVAPMARAARLPALMAAAKYKTALAMRGMEDDARAGRLPASVQGETLPAPLAEAVAAYQAINREFPLRRWATWSLWPAIRGHLPTGCPGRTRS